MSDLATLRIVVDSSGAIRAVDQFGKTAEGATKKANALNDAAKRVGTVVGGVLVAGLALAIKETADAQREQAQLAAALRSTGGAAGQTLDSLNDHATALRRMTAATGGQIAETQALLLTFTKISGDTFPAATQAVLDLSQALGTDVRGAAIQVGKALNDPILGVTALAKAGVQFSDQQKAVIKAFVDTNQMAKAQGVILAELNTQVAGSATAYRNTLGGALVAVRESFSELFEVASPGMIALVENLNIMADAIAQLPTRFAQATTGVQSFFNKALIALLEFNQRGRPSAMLDNARARQGGLDATGAGLDALLAQQQRDVIAGILARANAGSGGGLAMGGAGVPDPVIVTAAAEAVKSFHNALKDLGKGIDQDAAVRAKADRLLKQGVKDTAEAVEELSEAARVFLEQTQIAVARFFSDFLKDGFSSIGRFWDDFKQLGRDAIGNVFAKEFMNGIGGKIADKLSGVIGGAMGKIGGLGAGVLGPLAAIGGITAGVLSMFGRTSKWEEAAEAQNKAARAQLAAAETLRMTVTQQQAAFRDNFLNYANTETATEREIRNLANQRTQLGRDAYGIAMTATGGTGLSNQVKQLLESGNFSQTVIDLIRRDAGSFNMSQFARDNLLQFADSLEELNEAFQRNTKAATEAARAQSLLSLTQFRDSLALSAQSPLSPTAQLAEARRQYDVILALAKAGDQSAISSLPETARTLLDASRAVNASGMRYADDFARVTADTTALIDNLQSQATDVSDTILERTEPWFADQLAATEATLTVQQQGFQAVVDELVNVKAELIVMKDALKLSLDDVALAVS